MNREQSPFHDDLYVAVHLFHKAARGADHQAYLVAQQALQAAMEAAAPGENHIMLLWPECDEAWDIYRHQLSTRHSWEWVRRINARVILLPPQQDFGVAIRADEDLTDENKARWLAEIAAEQAAQEGAAS